MKVIRIIKDTGIVVIDRPGEPLEVYTTEQYTLTLLQDTWWARMKNRMGL